MKPVRSVCCLFGNLALRSQRWNHCGCQPNQAKTFSPLLGVLNEHMSPERLYLETKWGSLISFELAADLLKDTLPRPVWSAFQSGGWPNEVNSLSFLCLWWKSLTIEDANGTPHT